MKRRKMSRLHALVVSILTRGAVPLYPAVPTTDTLNASFGLYFQDIDVNVFRDSYLSWCLLSKDDVDLNIDRVGAALATFGRCEDLCATVNLTAETRWGAKCAEPAVRSIFMMAREKISKVLGECTPQAVFARVRFGPGASTHHKRANSHASYKLEKGGVSGTCYPLLSAYRTWRGLDDVPGVVLLRDDAKITTVPKSPKTDRTIAIEPSWNMFFQLGVGGYIRQRLRGVGLDLDKSFVLNQEYARKGSLGEGFATVDLKSASDCISESLVNTLLPEEWVWYLNSIRTRRYTLPSGKLGTYQKFSTMGNGFTFELETLIFWALLNSYRRYFGRGADRSRDLPVFGDDIVIEDELFDGFCQFMERCGFAANRDKSFGSGFFRESCGKHFYKGVDVTPIYIRKPVDTPQRLYWLINQLKRHARLAYGLDGRYEGIVGDLVACAPLSPPLIPDGFGDGGIISDFDETLPQRTNHPFRPAIIRRAKHGIEGYTFRHQIDGTHTYQRSSQSFLDAYLLGYSDKPLPSDSREYCITVKAGPVRTVKGHVVHWPSYGPWLHEQLTQTRA